MLQDLYQNDDLLANFCFSGNLNVFKWQCSQKVKVWAGILGNVIIVFLFIEENLVGDLTMIEKSIHPLII